MKYLRNKWCIKGCLLFSILVTAGWIWHEETEAYHFTTVASGVLYRSGWMQPHGMDEKIKEYGIRTIVNLCLPSEEMYLKNNNYLKEQEICKSNGVKLVYLPIPGNAPPAQEQIDQWLDLLKDSSNFPVLVHCAQGVTRTGTMTAIYEMEFQHKSNEEAMAQLPMFGHKLDVPKRKELCDFLRDYKPHMQPESQSKHNLTRNRKKLPG